MIKAAFEHVALNVPDRDAAVAWYVEHLGLRVVREVPGAMAFLADADGTVVFELYNNRDAGRIDFPKTDTLALHIAFEVDDPRTAADELVAGGASVAEAYKEVGDDAMIMLRDPFGVGLQLVHRGTRMRTS